MVSHSVYRRATLVMEDEYLESKMMLGTSIDRDAAEVAAALDHLDLTVVKTRLMDMTHGKGWTQEAADRAEVRYKRFLFLTVTRKGHVVPTVEIDAFWHAHLLATRKYAEDCAEVFGVFLHHDPQFGIGSVEAQAHLVRSFQETCRIYEEIYGEPYLDSPEEPLNCSSCSSCAGEAALA